MTDYDRTGWVDVSVWLMCLKGKPKGENEKLWVGRLPAVPRAGDLFDMEVGQEGLYKVTATSFTARGHVTVVVERLEW